MMVDGILGGIVLCAFSVCLIALIIFAFAAIATILTAIGQFLYGLSFITK